MKAKTVIRASEIRTTFIDRKGWPSGPWDDEPDRIEWRNGGLPCLMLRQRMGIWCGYVGVPPSHPLFGAKVYEDAVERLQVHGSVTFGSECIGEPPEAVCHVPRVDETGHVYWFGFDHAHGGDVIPTCKGVFKHPSAPVVFGDQSYKDESYVKDQVNRLAEQLL